MRYLALSPLIALVISGTAARASVEPRTAAPTACQRFVAGERDADLASVLAAATKHDPTQHCAPLYLGLLHREQGRLPAAVTAFETGVRRHPDHLPLLLELAVTLSWNQRIEDALTLYRRAQAIAPESLPAHLGEARMLAWLARFDEAERLYLALEATWPRHPDILKGLAFVYRARLQLAAAKVLYRTVLVRHPDDTEAVEGLAAIADVQRWQIQAGGASRVTEPHFHISLRYQRRARSFLSLRVAREDPVFRDPLFAATETLPVRALRGAVSHGLGRNTTAAVELEIRRRANRTQDRFLGAEIQHRASDSATLVAGIRQGENRREGTSLLAFVGAAWTGGGGELGLQVFASRDPRGRSGGALAASWRTTLLRQRLRLRLGGTVGREPGGDFVQSSIDLGYRLGETLELGAGCQLVHGRFRRLAITSEITLRL